MENLVDKLDKLADKEEQLADKSQENDKNKNSDDKKEKNDPHFQAAAKTGAQLRETVIQKAQAKIGGDEPEHQMQCAHRHD